MDGVKSSLRITNHGLVSSKLTFRHSYPNSSPMPRFQSVVAGAHPEIQGRRLFFSIQRIHWQIERRRTLLNNDPKTI